MWNSFANSRVEICRDRHDRRSCKICASCVNFPGKKRNFSHNLRRTSRFTHTKCDFAKLLKLDTLKKILTKKLLKYLIVMHLHCLFFLDKIVAIYALSVCKIFSPKIWLCKFFDKSQVCYYCGKIGICPPVQEAAGRWGRKSLPPLIPCREGLESSRRGVRTQLIL